MKDLNDKLRLILQRPKTKPRRVHASSRPNRIQPSMGGNDMSPPRPRSKVNSFNPFTQLKLYTESSTRFPKKGTTYYEELKQTVAAIYREEGTEPRQQNEKDSKWKKLVRQSGGIKNLNVDDVLGYRIKENGVTEYLREWYPEELCSPALKCDIESPEQYFSQNSPSVTNKTYEVVDLTSPPDTLVRPFRKSIVVDLTIDVVDLD